MSRSGYSNCGELDQRDVAMWRGRVASAIRGKRGQRLLRDLIESLDALPQKRLVPDLLVDGGEVCALGSCGIHRRVEGLENIDPEDHVGLSQMFDVAACMIQEIEHVNDEAGKRWDSNGPVDDPERRWKEVRAWAVENLNKGLVAGEEL